MLQTIASAIGELTLQIASGTLEAIYFGDPPEQQTPPTPITPQDRALSDEVRRQLEAYFEGKRTQFDLPLAPKGTPFQRVAWEALINIPYGETRSYKEQAQAIGRPNAVRAVGSANNRNPIPVLIPCHRVIGTNGKLVGYAGGLGIKKHLLELEGVSQHPNANSTHANLR